MNVTVVTVTYGKRAHLLTQVLDAAREQGVVEAVVIDNGSADRVATILAERYGEWAFVHAMGGNTGSALGFKTGIKQALARGAEFLLLLDDDNVLQPGCLDVLMAVFKRRVGDGDPCRLALSAWREGRQAWVEPEKARVRKNSSNFVSFRFQNLPRIILKKFRTAKPVIKPNSVEIQIPNAVYGGFFMHRNLVNFIGLPSEDFYVYGDDTEFTNRYVRRGGEIILVADACIVDVAASWYEKSKSSFAPFVWAKEGAKPTKYYQFRNSVYMAYHVNDSFMPALILNTIIFMGTTLCVCVIVGEWQMARLLTRAFLDGLKGRLGKVSGIDLS